MNRLTFAVVALLAAVPCAALTLSADDAPQEDPLAPEAQRILVVATQASGTGVFMDLLGQELNTVSFQDANIDAPADTYFRPQDIMRARDIKHVVLKFNLHGDEVSEDPLQRLRNIQERFQPHKTILAMRHPVENYEKLKAHAIGANPLDFVDTNCSTTTPPELDAGGDHLYTFGRRCGSPEGKLRALETVYEAFQKNSSLFDAVIYIGDLLNHETHHEEVVTTMNSIGFPLLLSHFDLKQRPSSEIFERSEGAIAPTEDPLQPNRHRGFEWYTGDFYDLAMVKTWSSDDNHFTEESLLWAQKNLPALMGVSWDTMRSCLASGLVAIAP